MIHTSKPANFTTVMLAVISKFVQKDGGAISRVAEESRWSVARVNVDRKLEPVATVH